MFQKLGGRKFLAFIIATILIAFGLISDQVWLVCFIVYTGANVAQKIGISFIQAHKRGDVNEEIKLD